MARKQYRIPDQKSVTYGINPEDIAMICEVSLRTACRWKSGQVAMPPAARMLLCGDLACIDPGWAGWRICRGVLISPEGWEITVNDVLAVPLMRQQIAAYQTEMRLARERLLLMQEQPAAEDWPEWVFELQA